MVRIVQVDPAELSPGQLSHKIREAVEEWGASIVVIDSLNGYLNAMPEERFLTIQLHELLMYLSQKGVATVLIGAHERTIRDFSMRDGRIGVGESLRNFRGVLTGVPVFDNSPDPALSADHLV